MVKTVDTKTRIIEASIELFHAKGIHWVSFQKIATEVGISQPAIYKHFKDKDDLIMGCANYAARYGRAFIDQMLAEQSTAEGKLKAYLNGNLMWLSKYPKHALMLVSIYYFGYNNHTIGELLKVFNQQSELRIRTRLQLGQDMLEWQIPDIESTARVIHNILIGEMFKALHQPDEMSSLIRTGLIWSQVKKLIS